MTKWPSSVPASDALKSRWQSAAGCNGRRGRSAADEVEGAHGPGAASARTWLRSPPRWSPYAVPFIGACAGDPMRQSSPKRSTCAYCAYRTWRQSAIPEPISTRWPVTSRGTMPVASAMAPRWHAGVRRAPPLAVGPAYAGAPAPDSMLRSRHAYGVFPVWLQWIDTIYDSGMRRPTLLPPSCPLTL